MPKFSIVIATYNRAGFLNRALDSLISQTEADWEAWIIDDGSTDHTEDILKDYLSKYKNIYYHKINKSGEAYAKNTGISLSTGEYITFLDSDDAYEPDHLAHRKTILQHNPETQLLHGGIKIIGDPFVPDRHQPNTSIHLSQCIIGATFFIHHEAISILNGFEKLPIGNDAALYEKAVKANLNILKSDYPSYIYYRNHSDSITHNIAKKAH